MLAGLPQAASRLNPCSTAKVKVDGVEKTKAALAEERRQHVLTRMWATGMFKNQAEYEHARVAVGYECRSVGTPLSVSYAPQYAKAEFAKKLGADAINRGYTVYTSVHPELQRAAEAALTAVVNEVNAKFPPSSVVRTIEQQRKKTMAVSSVDGAVVVLRVKDRAILAMVGGIGVGVSTLNRAFQTKRQGGSTLKLCPYGAAIERGATTSDICIDQPLSFSMPGNKVWEPKNYDEKYGWRLSATDPDEDRIAETPLWHAFATSRNICAIVVTSSVGPENVNEFCRRGGIRSRQDDVLATGIGGAGGVTLLELTNVYATAAAGGLHAEPRVIERIVNRDGGTAYEDELYIRQVWSATVAYQLLSMELGVVQHPAGTGHRLAKYAKDGIRVAGKTGTTGDYKDAYFCGVTPEIAFCVWLGRDSDDPISDKQGSGLAVDVADRLLGAVKPLLTPNLEFPVPPTIEFHSVGMDGVATSTATPGATVQPFPKGRRPPGAPYDLVVLRHISQDMTEEGAAANDPRSDDSIATEEPSVGTTPGESDEDEGDEIWIPVPEPR